jgi:hypothetical protein
MTITLSSKHRPFPQPDLAGIKHYREVITQCAAIQGLGHLRAQLLTVLDRVYQVDTKAITMLDGVASSLGNLDIETYRAALQALERDGRTLEENLAFVSYQEQAASDFLDRLRIARGYVDALNRCVDSLAAAELADTRESIRHAEALLASAGMQGTESDRRPLNYLLEDLKGAASAADARRGYVDAVNALMSPVVFFCHSVPASGQTGLQLVEDFQRRARELDDYLQAARRQWQA